MHIRPIVANDNEQMATIIRKSLKAVGLDKPGTAYFDPSLDRLAETYVSDERSAYFVLDDQGKVMGGAGFALLSDDICELQKLYVSETVRGQGWGCRLIETVIAEARAAGFKQLYLETTDVLAQAVSLYEALGFKALDEPLANDNGHHAMTIWMVKDLKGSSAEKAILSPVAPREKVI